MNRDISFAVKWNLTDLHDQILFGPWENLAPHKMM